MKITGRRLAAVAVVGALLAGWVTVRAWDRLLGNVPVQFYGRVVDTQGAPIPDATVRARIVAVRRWQIPHPLTLKREEQPVTATTDAEGRFLLHATRGKFVRIEGISKAGWEPAGGWIGISTTFEYPKGTVGSPPTNADRAVVYPMQHIQPPSGKVKGPPKTRVRNLYHKGSKRGGGSGSPRGGDAPESQPRGARGCSPVKGQR